MAQWMKELDEEYPNFNTVGETWVTEPAYTATWQKDSKLAKSNSYLKTVMDFSFYDKINTAKYEETDPWFGGIWQLLSRACAFSLFLISHFYFFALFSYRGCGGEGSLFPLLFLLPDCSYFNGPFVQLEEELGDEFETGTHLQDFFGEDADHDLVRVLAYVWHVAFLSLIGSVTITPLHQHPGNSRRKLEFGNPGKETGSGIWKITQVYVGNYGLNRRNFFESFSGGFPKMPECWNSRATKKRAEGVCTLQGKGLKVRVRDRGGGGDF